MYWVRTVAPMVVRWHFGKHNSISLVPYMYYTTRVKRFMDNSLGAFNL